MTSASSLPIRWVDILPYKPQVATLLNKVEWSPVKTFQLEGKARSGSADRLFQGNIAGAQNSSVMEAASAIAKDEMLLPEGIHHTLLVLEKGLMIGMHLGALFGRATNIEELRTRGELSDLQKVELANKLTTTAAVAAFATASYVVWELGGYRQEEVSAVMMGFDGIPELDLKSPITARKCLLFYYGSYLEKSGKVISELDFVKFTILYFRAVITDVKLREGQLLYKEAFTDRKYGLEESEFILDGFEELSDRSTASVEFDRISFKQIVGNERAIHGTERMFDRLFSYDFETKRNPFSEFGALARIRAGFGSAGTGKTLLAKAGATRGEERAKWLGVPFLYHEFPGNMVSSLQGQSAERMDNWMRPFRDPTKIIYGVIDDAETNFEDRKRQGASEGSRLIVGSFLRNSEGVSVIDRGNWMLDFLTNIIHQMDPAALSRVAVRYPIDGALTAEQFAAQGYMGWRKYQEMNPELIDIVTPDGYDYFASQKASGEQATGYREAKNERIKAIVEKILKQFDLRHHLFFGKLYEAVKVEFPSFTSRDYRNIQTAVSGRMFDFDFEQDWRDDPEVFYRRDYGTKRGMIIELMKANMKGLSFSEMCFEESLYYLDNFANITNVEFEDQVHRVMEAERVNREAIRRLGRL